MNITLDSLDPTLLYEQPTETTGSRLKEAFPIITGSLLISVGCFLVFRQWDGNFMLAHLYPFSLLTTITVIATEIFLATPLIAIHSKNTSEFKYSITVISSALCVLMISLPFFVATYLAYL